jgi:hypothetical protein
VLQYFATCVKHLLKLLKGFGDAKTRLVIGIAAIAATSLTAIQANIRRSQFAARTTIHCFLLIFQK